MIWLVAKSVLLRFGADFALLPTRTQHLHRASNPNHSPFITNGLLFVLHSIQTNMILYFMMYKLFWS